MSWPTTRDRGSARKEGGKDEKKRECESRKVMGRGQYEIIRIIPGASKTSNKPIFQKRTHRVCKSLFLLCVTKRKKKKESAGSST